MRVKSIFAAVLLTLTAASPASAQFLPDLQDLFGRGDQQQPRRQGNAVTVDYNVDFHYFLDVRMFNASDDIFVESETINLARVSPSAVVRFNQGNQVTHRLSLGIDLTKDMGTNPTRIETYSDEEHQSSIRNLDLMKDIFFYYNYSRHMGGKDLGFYAGIHPRTVLQGDYPRAIMADDLIYYDPNIEGITFQYASPRFSFELAGDLMGKKGVDRIGGEMAFTHMEYRPFKWAALGLAGSYTHVVGNYLYPCEVEYAIANPYLKFDFAPLFHMQEFYIKGGVLGTYQLDHRIRLLDDETGEIVGDKPHFPNGAEATIGIRHWGIGIEDTFYYGENLNTYKSTSYEDISNSKKYIEALYHGDEFYFTRRTVPTWYNRAEVYWQPLLTDFVSARVSAVGHFITPAGKDPESRIGPYVGMQAKAALLFNLDAFRYQRSGAPDGRTARSRRAGRRSADGPLFSL